MTSLQIIRGLAQAAANSFDGALDENGKPVKIGLKREEGNPMLDSRTIDGFKVSFRGPILCIKYQTETKLKEVHQKGFESDIGATIGNIAKYLQKEYKKITGSSVSLKPVGDPKIVVSHISRIRTDTCAYQHFNIGGLSEVKSYGKDTSNPDEKRTVDDAIKNFLSLKSKKQPKNRKTRKPSKKLDDIYKA